MFVRMTYLCSIKFTTHIHHMSLTLTFYSQDADQLDEVYCGSVTDNLFSMASEAGLFDCLWNNKGSIRATADLDLIEPLRSGIELLKSDPNRFRVYDSPNGWGTYDQFVPWLEELLKECIDCPECLVYFS